MITRFVSAALALLALSGCVATVGPEARRPVPPPRVVMEQQAPPAGYYQAPPPVATAPPPAYYQGQPQVMAAPPMALSAPLHPAAPLPVTTPGHVQLGYDTPSKDLERALRDAGCDVEKTWEEDHQRTKIVGRNCKRPPSF